MDFVRRTTEPPFHHASRPVSDSDGEPDPIAPIVAFAAAAGAVAAVGENYCWSGSGFRLSRSQALWCRQPLLPTASGSAALKLYVWDGGCTVGFG